MFEVVRVPACNCAQSACFNQYCTGGGGAASAWLVTGDERALLLAGRRKSPGVQHVRPAGLRRARWRGPLPGSAGPGGWRFIVGSWRSEGRRWPRRRRRSRGRQVDIGPADARRHADEQPSAGTMTADRRRWDPTAAGRPGGRAAGDGTTGADDRAPATIRLSINVFAKHRRSGCAGRFGCRCDDLTTLTFIRSADRTGVLERVN